MADLQTQFDELSKEHGKLKKDHDKLTREHEKLAGEREAIDGQLSEAVTAQKNAVAERDDLAKQLEAAQGEANRASDANGTLQKDRDELAGKVEELTKALDDEKTAHGETKAALKTAKAAPKVSRGPKSPTAREAAPMKFSDANPQPSAQELYEAIKAAPHTILLSDGKRELLHIPPINVTAEAFQLGPTGLVMTEPVKITPDEPTTIKGYALFDDKGRQVDWRDVPTPIQVSANQSIELRREFVFGRP